MTNYYALIKNNEIIGVTMSRRVAEKIAEEQAAEIREFPDADGKVYWAVAIKKDGSIFNVTDTGKTPFSRDTPAAYSETVCEDYTVLCTFAKDCEGAAKNIKILYDHGMIDFYNGGNNEPDTD